MRTEVAPSRSAWKIAFACVAVVLLAVGLGLEFNLANQKSAVSAPSTRTEDYSCRVSDSSAVGGPATVVLNSSDSIKYTLEVIPSHGLSILATTCSYYFFQRTTPVACTKCETGTEDVEALGNNLALDFSAASVGEGTLSLNVTAMGPSVPFGFFAAGNAPQVWLNSEKVTWYSSPPCKSGTPIQDNCLGAGAVSIIVRLPALTAGNQYQLLLNSTTTLNS